MLEAALDRHRSSRVSAAFLLESKHATAWKVCEKGKPFTAIDNVKHAIEAAKILPDNTTYLWEIHFDGQNLRTDVRRRPELRFSDN
jgi:hypothetical protein